MSNSSNLFAALAPITRQPADPLVGLAINPGEPELVMPTATDLDALGVRWVRWLLAHRAQNYETGQNTELDLLLTRYANLHVQVLVLINTETLDVNPPAHGSADWDAYNTHVAELAQKIAAFYRGRIVAIEIFNEPDNLEIDPDDYGTLLGVVYPRVKAGNPLLPVIAAGIMWGENHEYLRRVVAASHGAFDAAGWHPYGEAVEGYPEAIWGIGDLRKSITRARAIAGKPLWLTEMGAELGYTWPSGISAEAAVGEYLTRVYALLRELGADTVTHCFWFTYAIPESGWGILDNTGARRPAWYALQAQTNHAPAVPLITDVAFAPNPVMVNQPLYVRITVTNYSTLPMNTQGPEPGLLYREDQTFATVDNGYPPTPGAFRVGLDFNGNTGVDHPYRWGLGTPLAPGETRVITGAIQMKTERAAYFWAGLVQEGIAWMEDVVQPTAILVQPWVPEQNPEIVSVAFQPTTVDQGQVIWVDLTVRNNTGNTLATQGPDPGFVYGEGETFYTRNFPDVRGAFRVGIDFDGRTGVDHPYRWGLGAPLAPGETRTISGAIRLHTILARQYWAGLVHENIAWVQDRQGAQAITVNPATAPQITAVTFSPTTVNAGDQLQVEFQVRNDSATTCPTQDPAPGFVYTEGETFETRNFPATAGCVRLGVDFAQRTGIDHPYRWGLGTPLAPGETRTVTGFIQLKRPQTQKYWAGLVQEWVAWHQDQQGAQTITVPGDLPKPRVVQVHHPHATTWTGLEPEYWNTVNQTAVDAMVARGMIELTGANALAEAWQVLLPQYQPGEGIAVKVNVTNDGNGLLDALIQTVNALARGLIARGVQPSDIWIYEPLHVMPARFIEGCLYPGIKFLHKGNPSDITFDSPDPDAVIHSVTPADIPPFPLTKLVDVLVRAKYVINLPMLKGHLGGAGLTLGFKHHLGSTNNPSGFHPYIFTAGAYFRNDYNPLVDLNANPHVRNKTVLTLGDGLFGGDRWNTPPTLFKTFGNQTPSSLFLSVDPVACDCVMADFVCAEFTIPGGAGNYLALAGQRGLGVYERGDPHGAGYHAIDFRRIEL